jgi:hypothetical protein
VNLRWLRPKNWAGETDGVNGSGQRDQALTPRVVKNRGGEKGQIAFDFFPSFFKVAEAG